MNIIVCLKPVKHELVYPQEKNTQELIINPFDLHALIKSLELKKSVKCKITCLCMGGINSKEMMQRAIAMGADECFLVSDPNFAGSDTVATSYILSKAIKLLGGSDLIVCGARSIDGETGQVVYGLAERLNYYCVSNLINIDSIIGENINLIHKEENYIIRARAKMPLVVSFESFQTEKPIISLLALKRAKKIDITILNKDDLNVNLSLCGLKGSKTKVMEIRKGFETKEKEIIEGTIEEKAEYLIKIIKEVY